MYGVDTGRPCQAPWDKNVMLCTDESIYLLSRLQVDGLELDDPGIGVGDLLVHVDVEHNPAHLKE